MDPDALVPFNCGFLQVGPERRVERVNDALATWRGLPEDHLRGRDLGVLLARGSLVYWESTVEALLEQQGHAWDLALELRAEGGDRVPVLVNARREEGVTECLVLPYRERRRFERRILEAEVHASRQEAEIERLEAIDAFQREFINHAAHELSTPMTPLKLQLHLARKALEANPDPKLGRAMDVIEANVGKLAKLISSLLDSARVEAGRVGVHVGPVALHELLPRAVDAWRREHAPQRRIEVEAHEASILADADVLASVLGHLLENAIKFSSPDSVVRVRTVPGDPVQVQVVDAGRGIEPGRLPELGRPFAQVHDRSQVTALGAGLGLHIVSGLMDAQGGRLVVHSEGRGRGTTAILEFPRAVDVEEGHVSASAAGVARR